MPENARVPAHGDPLPEGCFLAAHQPNLLASLAVVSPLLVGAADARKSSVPFAFKAVDYDAAGDQRFRTPVLPSMPTSPHPNLNLSGAVVRNKRNQPAFAVEFQSSTIQRWRDTYKQALRSWQRETALTPTSRTAPVLDKLTNESLTAVGLSQLLDDLTELSARPLSVPASVVWAECCSELTHDLLTSVSCSSRLFWLHCPACSERSPTDYETGWITAQCSTCNLRFRSHLKHIDPTRWLPRVDLCNAIDIAFVRPSRLYLYSSSAQHFEQTVTALRSKGFKVPSRVYVNINGLSDHGDRPVPDRHQHLFDRGRYSVRFLLDSRWASGPALAAKARRHAIVTVK